jgi:hypothetical protein
MEKITFKIDKINLSQGVGKNGLPWTRYEFVTQQGKKYSTFDKAIGDKFKVGDMVIISGEQDGQYFNMKTMELWQGSSVGEIQTNPVQSVKSFDVQQAIIRQSCLKAAVEYYKDESVIMAEIIATANGFVNWVNGK